MGERRASARGYPPDATPDTIHDAIQMPSRCRPDDLPMPARCAPNGCLIVSGGRVSRAEIGTNHHIIMVTLECLGTLPDARRLASMTRRERSGMAN